MKISVVIPTHNRIARLKICLQHLEHQDIPLTEFEVFVVDDGSMDGTADFLSSYQKTAPFMFNFFVQENKGPGAARNYAIKNAHASIILLIGDDIYATSSLLSEHIKLHTLYAEEKSACLGFVTWYQSNNITPLMKFLESGRALLGRFGGGQFAYDLLKGKKNASWNFFYTANISLKRSLLMKYLFDESFKGYGWEDIDLGLRLYKKEKCILHYVPAAIAYHDHPQTVESFVKREFQVGKALVFFQSKHPDQMLLPSMVKRCVLKIISCLFSASLFNYIWPNLYFYALSKKYFLAGLKQGILQEEK